MGQNISLRLLKLNVRYMVKSSLGKCLDFDFNKKFFLAPTGPPRSEDVCLSIRPFDILLKKSSRF